MAIAVELSLPTSLPSAVDCWPRISVAVASETRVTAIAATTGNSIITASNAAAVNAANAGQWSGLSRQRPDCNRTTADYDYGSDCRGSWDCRKARMTDVVVANGLSEDNNPGGAIVV